MKNRYIILIVISIMESYESHIIILDLLGKLRNGDKVNILEGQITIEHPSWISSIRRWYTEDNRRKTLEFLQNIVNKTKSLFDNKEISKERLVRSTYNALSGLRCLSFTYSDDLHFVTSIENITQQFEIIINNTK